VNEQGDKVLFAQPKAQRGLRAFFGLYRFLPAQTHGFNYDQCVNSFARGDAAVAIIGADDAIALWKNENTSPQVRQNIGLAPLPGVPWVGGDNLVIWKHVLGSSKCERDAVALVTHLTESTTQLQYARLSNSLPVRRSALTAFLADLEPFADTIEQAFANGRSHAPVRLWSRIEHQLGLGLDAVAAQVLESPPGEIDEIIRSNLEPLAARLDLR
jgi:maltose-binding protein MalE